MNINLGAVFALCGEELSVFPYKRGLEGKEFSNVLSAKEPIINLGVVFALWRRAFGLAFKRGLNGKELSKGAKRLQGETHCLNPRSR